MSCINWKQLFIQDLINGSNNPMEKLFLTNISESNLEYVITNHQHIIDPRIKIYSFIIGCLCSNDIQMIDYLKDCFKINKNELEKEYRDGNCLMHACMYNTSLEVIKHLIEIIKIDPMIKSSSGYNCLSFACHSNTNIDIIKYLIEDIHVDLYSVDILHTNCLTRASYSNSNHQIIKYLIENTDLVYQYIPYSTYKLIIGIIKNYTRFNQYLKHGIESYGINKNYNEILRKINPLILDPSMCIKFDLHPFNDCFKTFISNVHLLVPGVSVIPINFDHMDIRPVVKKLFDFSIKWEPLFIHQGIIYYGSRNIVYDSIYVLEEIDCYDIHELPELSSHVPEYVIRKYLQATYDHVFVLDHILPGDLKQFLMFIDQYPSKVVSIDLLEKDLILYMDKNLILVDEYMMNICIKYQLKYMYLYFYQNSM